LLGVVLAWIGVMAIAWILVHYWAICTDPRRHPLLRRSARLAREFMEAAVDLIAPRTARSLIPTAGYMLIYAVDLFVIIRAVGVDNISFLHTMAIYAIVVLAVVLVPIPTEIGITEFTGFGALEAYGVPASTAAIIMLSLRLLATGLTMVVAGLILLLLRGELRVAERQPGRVHTRDTSGGEVPAES
jgi:uncharacterized membrane protein YbhN (UPF0104 family)